MARQHPYSYKVMLTHEDCFTKRFVAFHEEGFLKWPAIAANAVRRLFSQTCPNCGKNHPDNEYVATDVSRGEPDAYGSYFYRDVYPDSVDYNEQELPF